MGFWQEKGLLRELCKSIVSSLSRILLRKSKFQTPMQIRSYLQPGLKTLIYSEETPLIIHSFSVAYSSLSPRSLQSSAFHSLFRSLATTHSSLFLSSSSGFDDLLGTESGVYMSSGEGKMQEPDFPLDIAKGSDDHKYNDHGKRSRGCTNTASRKYPPPIHFLAQTGNLPSHMPWVFTRHYSNGRLIITEERVKHHEHFEIRRENGRLILNLVPLDDNILTCCHTVSEELRFSKEDLEELTEFDFLEELLHDDQESNIEDHEDDGFWHQGHSIIINGVSSSVPKLFNGRQGLHPRKCFTYSDGFMISSEYQNLFANHDVADHSSTCDLAHSNSAPFTFGARPVAAIT